MSKRLLFIFAVISVNFAAAQAKALETPWVPAQQVQGQIITGVDTVGPQDSFEALLQLRLSQDWHTYWRVPGDAGLPPRFDWSGSENIADVAVSWPAPQREQELDFQTFSYSGDVGFPLVVKLKEPGKPAHIALKAAVMTCNEICIPEKLEIALDIPAGDGAASAGQKLVDFAKRRVPQKENENLRIDTVVAGPEGLVINVFSKSGIAGLDIFPVAGDFAFSALPQVTPDASDPQKAMIKVPVPAGAENPVEFLSGKTLSVTVVSGSEAVEKEISY